MGKDSKSRSRSRSRSGKKTSKSKSRSRSRSKMSKSRSKSKSRSRSKSKGKRSPSRGDSKERDAKKSKSDSKSRSDRQLRRMETPGDRDQGPPPRMGTPLPTRMATLLGTIEQKRTHLEIFKGIFSIFTQQANCSQNTPCDQLVHTTTRRVLHLSSIQNCLPGH